MRFGKDRTGPGLGGLVPSYDGANLVNLLAELEIRLTGRSPTRGLQPDLARLVPQTRNYLMVVIDGLGDHQLAHPAALPLRRSRRAVLGAPFPTTTTVGLSSVATAAAPMQHGGIGYLQPIPAVDQVVNMMTWTDIMSGRRVGYDPAGFLPTPNLWERLHAARVRAVVFQPERSVNTPLGGMLYRGAEQHGYSSVSDIQPGVLFEDGRRTLAVVYTSRVDGAAHRYGQRSEQYKDALTATSQLWEGLARTLPDDTTLVGSADHGHTDIGSDGRIYLDRELTDHLRCWGDGRLLMFRGRLWRVRRIARRTGGRLVDTDQLRQWLGGGPPHPALRELPHAAVLAPPGTVILPYYLHGHPVGHHGGITPEELLVPLLVA